MKEEHREVIAKKCSHPHPKKKKKFPNLPTSRPVGGGSLLATASGNINTSVITPPPTNSRAVTNGQSKKASKPAAKLSKNAMLCHRKWQAEAEMQGGPNAKIVVSKPEAKKIIFQKFCDVGPMNINKM